MRFNWNRYLDLAKDLEAKGKTSPQDEAQLRCAVSRAYYAAFCIARNFLIREGHVPPKNEVHYYVYNEFSISEDEDRRRIGGYLKAMSSRRKRADYDDEYRQLTNEIDYHLVMAEEVIGDIQKLRPET